MYITRESIAELEGKFGRPVRAVGTIQATQRELGLIAHCAAKGRNHDVTLLIQEDIRLAVIRKHSYPPDVYRPPSGGVELGEPFEVGAAREAYEETGLTVRLKRYLLRVETTFRCEAQAFPWTTHVFSSERLAGPAEGVLEPVDTREIAAARWAEIGEVHGALRAGMLAMEIPGMRYRVDLQDLALANLGYPGPGGELHYLRVVPEESG